MLMYSAWNSNFMLDYWSSIGIIISVVTRLHQTTKDTPIFCIILLFICSDFCKYIFCQLLLHERSGRSIPNGQLQPNWSCGWCLVGKIKSTFLTSKIINIVKLIIQILSDSFLVFWKWESTAPIINADTLSGFNFWIVIYIIYYFFSKWRKITDLENFWNHVGPVLSRCLQLTSGR